LIDGLGHHVRALGEGAVGMDFDRRDVEKIGRGRGLRSRGSLVGPDGGYVVAGTTSSFGAGLGDVYVVKLDATGTVQWTTTVGATGNEWYVYSIVQTADSGYAIAGNTDSFGPGIPDMYICKLDASGTVQWTTTVGGTAGDVATSIIQTVDGGYAVGGYSSSSGAGGIDMCLVKLDASGDFQWARTVAGRQTTMVFRHQTIDVVCFDQALFWCGWGRYV
jgi:hypothetical protein